MAEAVAAAISWIATTGVEIAGFEIATSTILTATAAFSYAGHQKRRMERQARAAYNASLRDRTLTVRGTLEERELVMGRVRKGGFFYPIGTHGTDSENFVFIVVMAGHSISAVNTCYFDDTALTLDGDGYVTTSAFVNGTKSSAIASISLSGGGGSVTLPNTPVSGSVSVVVNRGENGTEEASASVVGNVVTVTGYDSSYSGTATVNYQYTDGTKHARIRWMMGSDSQTVFSDLVTQFPSLWTSNHRLRGCAYAVIELKYSQDIFPNGVPNFSADINGAETVYDPRTTSTGYSENPALLARWYALHPLGGRRTTAQLDEASFSAAANVCDTSVDYGDGSTELYQAGYVAKSGQAAAEVLDELCEAMAGRWGYTQGRVRVRAGAVGTPVATITQDWLLTRQMSTRARRPRSELRNVLQGTFNDVDTNFQTVQFSRVVDSAAVTSDGGELPGELELQAVFRNGQAQQVAATMLRYERQALTVSLTLKMRAWPLQLFDVVAITLPDMGWSAKLFEVLDRSFALGGGVTVTFKEIDASIFAFGSSFPVNDPAPNTELPDPRVVPTVGTLTVTSAPLVRADGSVGATTSISWPAITDAGVNVGGFVEVGIADARTGVLNIVRADRATGHDDTTLTPGIHYRIYARAVNGLGVRGDWSAPALHKIAVKTSAPADVSGLTAVATPGGVAIAVTPSVEADVRAGGSLELRVGASWAGGARIFRGPADRYVWPWPAAGTYTVRARWIDSTGNYSASDAVSSITVGDSSLIGTAQIIDDSATRIQESISAGPLSVTTSTNIKTLSETNPDSSARYLRASGSFTFTATAGGSGVTATLLITDGSSPVWIGEISLGAGASVTRTINFAQTFILGAGATGSYSIAQNISAGSFASNNYSNVTLATDLRFK